jgi:hypothetical protein
MSFVPNLKCKQCAGPVTKNAGPGYNCVSCGWRSVSEVYEDNN